MCADPWEKADTTREVREGDRRVARGNESGNARTDRIRCVNRDGAVTYFRTMISINV
jgi:hypothetical protein